MGLDALKRKWLAHTREKAEGERDSDDSQRKNKKLRELPRGLKWIVTFFACAMTLYHIYTAVAGVPNWVIHRPTHVMFVMVIAFITFKSTKKDSRIALAIDCVLALVSLLIWIYIEVHFERISTFINYVTPIYPLDMVVIVILILFTLELTRRTTG